MAFEVQQQPYLSAWLCLSDSCGDGQTCVFALKSSTSFPASSSVSHTHTHCLDEDSDWKSQEIG
eukprot:696243-Amphidinium_carterae.1